MIIYGATASPPSWNWQAGAPGIPNPWQQVSDLTFLLGYIARQPHVTTGEALALAATDPVLPVGVRALAAETALDTRDAAPANGDPA